MKQVPTHISAELLYFLKLFWNKQDIHTASHCAQPAGTGIITPPDFALSWGRPGVSSRHSKLVAQIRLLRQAPQTQSHPVTFTAPCKVLRMGKARSWNRFSAIFSQRQHFCLCIWASATSALQLDFHNITDMLFPTEVWLSHLQTPPLHVCVKLEETWQFYWPKEWNPYGSCAYNTLHYIMHKTAFLLLALHV